MKKILFFPLLAAVCASCEKTPSQTLQTDDPKAGFTWSTVTSKTITLAAPSNILNENGDTVAVNLQPGTYNIPTGIHTRLDTREAPASKTETDTESKIFFPASGRYATILVEDNFPHKGDYDMNDVVIGFRIEYILDPIYDPDRFSMVQTIRVTVLPRALGSSYELLGLGLAFNGALITQIDRVTGDHTENLGDLFAVDKKNVETGSAVGSPVVPLSGDLRSNFTIRQTGMINTFEKLAYNSGKPFTATVELDKRLDLNDLELFGNGSGRKANMDLFVVIGNRGKEIHLKGQQPTAKFDRNLFSKLTDFVTEDHYVWMVVVDKEIAYPTENSGIELAYPGFADWVNQNGNLPYDWYDTFEPEYVYKKN